MTRDEFIDKVDQILKIEQDTAYAYKDIYDNCVKKFGANFIAKKLYAIYIVELEHISLAEKIMQVLRK